MSTPTHLEKEMRRLTRCMDFASRHPALTRPGREARNLTDIYQLLALAWEFLALQCPHRSGWRQSKDGKPVCKVCGTIKGTAEHWLLLPRRKPKTIGRMVRPTTERTLPDRKKATVIKDAVNFHGTKLSVEVLNPHKSRLFRSRDITISADRLVELHEGVVVCALDDHMLRIRFGRRRRGSEPPFADFLAELPKRVLMKLPVMAETDRQGRFVGLVIFKPAARQLGAKAGHRIPRD